MEDKIQLLRQSYEEELVEPPRKLEQLQSNSV